MELHNNKCAIITVGDRPWYNKGVERLEKSLNYHGFFGDIFSWKNTLPPNSESHEVNPYNFKIHAFQHAFDHGFTHVLWLDASLWAVAPVMPIFDYFNTKGIFAFRTGFNCAQTAPDNLLRYADITREQAEKMPEYATGCVGLNINNPDAQNVFDVWDDMRKRGLFKNSRVHDPKDSTHYLFKFGRQDQSAFSMAMHMHDVDIPQTEFVSYYKKEGAPKNTIFMIQGL